MIPEKMIMKEMIPTIQHPLIKSEFEQTYEEALSFSGLHLHKELSHRTVEIGGGEYVHEVYTKGNSDLPHLLLLHGFGNSSLGFIRLFQYLHPHYQVHAIDVFGMGLSSRGNWADTFSPEETRLYYTQPIERWRKALEIQKFYFVGHSFGGYLAACYCERYPQRIRHLSLLSPVGTSDQHHQGLGQKMLQWFAGRLFSLNIRPSTALMNSWFREMILEKVCGEKLKFEGREKEVWKQYIRVVASQETSSEVGFYRLFNSPFDSKRPIEQMLKESEFPFQINCYFGDVDWMDRSGMNRLLEGNQRISMHIIQNAGHQIMLDTPQEICQHIFSSHFPEKQYHE